LPIVGNALAAIAAAPTDVLRRGLVVFKARLLQLAGIALDATLIFRGLTLWLPMLPGLWCARRILRPPPMSRQRPAQG
jgi:hypothetical protein